MIDQPPLGRRLLLASLGALPAIARVGHARAAPSSAAAAMPFPESPRLLVAGPEDGVLNHWADALQPALEQSLPPDTAIRRVEIGSADGVTGANQFEVRGVPDGMTLLLVPGQATLAWMVGDSRAQFDVGHWVPVMAGMTSGIVVGRPGVLDSGVRVRVGAAGAASLDLAALLGLQLLGVPIQPVFGITDVTTAHSAFMQNAVDAVFLRGQRVPDQFSVMAASGAQSLFTIGILSEAGQATRDPAFPDVPHFSELYQTRSGRGPSGLLFGAWRAVAAAAQLDFGLVLQQLTPAAMVSLWRRAGVDAAAATPVQAVGTSLSVRLVAAPDATANTTATVASAPTLTELRGWLAGQLNWKPA